MRKIIQIVPKEHPHDKKLAVCNDGTIWVLENNGWRPWEIPGIPQPEVEPETLRKKYICEKCEDTHWLCEKCGSPRGKCICKGSRHVCECRTPK